MPSGQNRFSKMLSNNRKCKQKVNAKKLTQLHTKEVTLFTQRFAIKAIWVAILISDYLNKLHENPYNIIRDFENTHQAPNALWAKQIFRNVEQ